MNLAKPQSIRSSSPGENRIGETRRLHPFIELETNNEIIARVENVPYVYGCWTNRGDSIDSVLSALLNAAIFLLIPRAIPWDLPLHPFFPRLIRDQLGRARRVGNCVLLCRECCHFRSYSKIEIRLFYVYKRTASSENY